MKKIRLMLAMLLVGASAVVFNSCSQDEALDQSSMGVEISAYSKTLTIADASGFNSLELLVSSDDKSILDQYNNEMFKLSLFNEEVISNKVVVQNPNELYEASVNESSINRVSFSIRNKSFKSDHIGYMINVDYKFEEDLRLPWTEDDWESPDDNFSITRNDWNRVYYKWDKKIDGDWQYSYASYVKIPQNTTIRKFAPGSDNIKVFVKFRRESNFTLKFY